MKAITTLFFLVTCLVVQSQEITGVWFNWFGLLQDVSDQSDLSIANTSIIHLSDSTSHEASPDDSLTWVWSRMIKEGNSWTRIHLDTAFQLQPAIHIDDLCNGVFVIEVKAIDNRGREWSCQGPCRVYWTNACSPYVDPGDQIGCVPQCPQIMPFPFYTDNTWLNHDQSIRSFASSSWYEGKDFNQNKIGDFNIDGSVNVVDLLLFNGHYGN
jgi:hypothetical protein